MASCRGSQWGVARGERPARADAHWLCRGETKPLSFPAHRAVAPPLSCGWRPPVRPWPRCLPRIKLLLGEASRCGGPALESLSLGCEPGSRSGLPLPVGLLSGTCWRFPPIHDGENRSSFSSAGSRLFPTALWAGARVGRSPWKARGHLPERERGAMNESLITRTRLGRGRLGRPPAEPRLRLGSSSRTGTSQERTRVVAEFKALERDVPGAPRQVLGAPTCATCLLGAGYQCEDRPAHSAPGRGALQPTGVSNIYV